MPSSTIPQQLTVAVRSSERVAAGGSNVTAGQLLPVDIGI